MESLQFSACSVWYLPTNECLYKLSTHFWPSDIIMPSYNLVNISSGNSVLRSHLTILQEMLKISFLGYKFENDQLKIRATSPRGQWVNSMRPSYAYMRQQNNNHWYIVNSNLRNKHQWNLKRNSCIFIPENAFENGVCEMASILFRPQCVKLVDGKPSMTQSMYATLTELYVPCTFGKAKTIFYTRDSIVKGQNIMQNLETRVGNARVLHECSYYSHVCWQTGHDI